jgi:hypothetical protein
MAEALGHCDARSLFASRSAAVVYGASNMALSALVTVVDPAAAGADIYKLTIVLVVVLIGATSDDGVIVAVITSPAIARVGAGAAGGGPRRGGDDGGEAGGGRIMYRWSGGLRNACSISRSSTKDCSNARPAARCVLNASIARSVKFL